VLKVISGSPGELEPVFKAMLENAVRICEASFGNLLLYEGEAFRDVALHNAPEAWAADSERDPVPPHRSARILYRVADTKQVAHIADIAAQNPDEPITKIVGAPARSRAELTIFLLDPHFGGDGLVMAIRHRDPNKTRPIRHPSSWRPNWHRRQGLAVNGPTVRRRTTHGLKSKWRER